MKRILLVSILFSIGVAVSSCRDSKDNNSGQQTETKAKDDKGVLERAGEEADEKVNDEVDEQIDKINDDN